MSKAAPSQDIDFILSKMTDLLGSSSFKDERILLTGATGFFGKWLTQAILAMNDRWSARNHLTLVTRDRARTYAAMPWLLNRSDVLLLETDIRQFEPRSEFTSVIHGAAAASQALNEQDPVAMFDTIVEGTRQVLKATESKACRRFQFVSSGGVYGPQPESMTHIPESYLGAPDTMDPRAAYGEAKRAAELMCAAAQRKNGFRLTIPRCFAFVGPYLPLDIHFAAGNFVRAVLDGKAIAIGGDGTPERSYLYPADLTVWLLILLLSDEGPSIVNVGSSHAVSIAELARVTHEEGLKLRPERQRISPPITIAKTPVPGAKVARYVPDVTRAKEYYGLEEWTSLPQALHKTMIWNLSATSS